MSDWSFKREILASALFILGFAGYSATANADTELSFNKWVETVKITGDYRLRNDMFDKKTPGQVDRNRERFRLRLNLDFGLADHFAIKTTLASGTGEQVSTNQSFDNLSSQKGIWIDRAYLVWQPIEILKLQGGRMANPIWTQYSSDVVWDPDYNPEGFSESYSQLVGPVQLFANALQMVVDEDGGNNNTEGVTTSGGTNTFPAKNRDQWMIGEQVGAEFKLPLDTRARLAIANYEWINERFGDFGQVAINEGNRRTGGTTGSLINNFNVLEYTGGLSGWAFKIPVEIQGTYVKNKAARSFAGQPKEDTGFQVGGILGKAGMKNKMELAYFRKHVRTDATMADVSDSDFGDGGTNREGNIMWVAYSPIDFVTLQAKYFQTKVINTALAPGADDINRLQLDCSVKF